MSSAASNGHDDLSDVAVDSREWPVFPRTGAKGARRWDWMISSLLVVWLVSGTVETVRAGGSPALLIPLTIAYGGGYLLVWWVAPRWSPAYRVLMVALLFVLGIGYLLASGSNRSFGYLAYAVAAAVMLLPLAASRAIVVLTIASAMGFGLAADGQIDDQGTVVVALVGLLALTTSRMARLVGKLAVARSEIRTLAVAHERARLARDLHDVLGHSLTAITVKASLTRRLLESGRRVEDALAEVRDVENLARTTLGEVRATVAGQRRMTLVEELAAARAALRAAGIDADLPTSTDDVDTRLDEPLAYVLREGVTNVVRHSRARRCIVRVGRRWLEIVDDGVGPVNGAGNGLTGLSERLAAVEGTIETGPGPTGGFRLKAEIR
ncbi:sensor histidine kinase [Pseudonocardia spinosispora]|uniref:sensor histidine kinase n=1 Tax=Pseudonocardia spinosispora TaxID=103441 RepID=UPI00068796B5|nr:histidine kinase [Pseudonocardia spinosispora]